MAARYNQFILAVDLGTSGCKCALVGLDGIVRKWAVRSFPLHVVDKAGAEQDPEDWWSAFVAAARELTATLPDMNGEIAAICCSCQGECTIPVDRAGRPLHRALSWLDMRGADIIRRRAGSRMLAVSGYHPIKLVRWISRTGGAPALSGKDSAGHMAFIQEMWPQVYDQTYKFLNCLDYMNLRLTGRFVATVDSILTAWVTDNRDADNIGYDRRLIEQSGLGLEKLPDIVRCTDVLGPLCPGAAEELGLPEETPVVAGAVDNSAAAVGSGAVRDGEAHLYIGTSSWLGAHVSFKKTDVFAQIASVPCAVSGRYLAMAIQSSAGSNLSFLCDKILFPRDGRGTEPPSEPYWMLERIAGSVPAGARGLLYTPWIFGERSPVDNPNLRAGFLNLSLQHSREDMVRAVLEGVALNTRWMAAPFGAFLEKPLDEITVVGGGATSDVWCQIFADVLNLRVRQLECPIQANAAGAAFIGFVGVCKLSYADIPQLIRIRRVYTPDPAMRAVYDELFGTFRFAYQRLAPLYRKLNLGKQVQP
ncbi:MAG TPA: FGGY-family carbohydrate kinase [Silvibacterium sp.]|nr:FGGY-family carbohydrate kinase [Silvibacterium sp.]